MLADMKQFPWLDSEVGDSASDDGCDVHYAIIGKRIHDPVAVAALDGFARAGVLEGYFSWNIHLET